jgi:hypothetical protein
MELVSILSTIILLITTATTILSIAAYILYKIRERKARSGVADNAVVVPNEHLLMIAAQPSGDGTRHAPEPSFIQDGSHASQQERSGHQHGAFGFPSAPAGSMTPTLGATKREEKEEAKAPFTWEFTDSGF